MTSIYGLAAKDIAPIASELRRALGTGGTAKNGVVELQGDRRDSVIAHLTVSHPLLRLRRM